MKQRIEKTNQGTIIKAFKLASTRVIIIECVLHYAVMHTYWEEAILLENTNALTYKKLLLAPLPTDACAVSVRRSVSTDLLMNFKY